MKAVQISNYGSPETLKITNDAPKPTVTPGQLLIEVHSAGVNPVDVKICEGRLQQAVPLRFPATIGLDFSGVVDTVGNNVTGFEAGDEVFGEASLLKGGSGSFAEYVVVDAKNVAHKPTSINATSAAALPLAGISAWQALVDHIGISKGKKILIHGGAGGIGIFAILLAKHLGAYVAATVSTEDAQFVKELGVDEIIDYKKQAFEKLLSNYDAVYDVVGGDTYTKSFKVLKKGGIIVSSIEQPRIELEQQFGVNSVIQTTKVNKEDLSKLAGLVDKGIIKVVIDKTFPLEQTAAALTHLKNNHSRGKVVVQVKR